MSNPTKRPRGRPTVAAPREQGSIRLPPSMWAWIRGEAKRMGISRGELIERLVEAEWAKQPAASDRLADAGAAVGEG